MAGVEINNFTRRSAPRLSYAAVAKHVLPNWDISLVFVTAKKAYTLNKKLRRKSYIPNVLSYAVGEKSGEIIICVSEATKQAPAFQLPASSFLLLLFIHALLHLEGRAHGATMEKREATLLAQFTHEATNRNRHRHRHLPGKTGRH